MYFCVNEFEVNFNDGIFSGNEQKTLIYRVFVSSRELLMLRKKAFYQNNTYIGPTRKYTQVFFTEDYTPVQTMVRLNATCICIIDHK